MHSVLVKHFLYLNIIENDSVRYC